MCKESDARTRAHEMEQHLPEISREALWSAMRPRIPCIILSIYETQPRSEAGV
jgi:hypothetical protein